MRSTTTNSQQIESQCFAKALQCISIQAYVNIASAAGFAKVPHRGMQDMLAMTDKTCHSLSKPVRSCQIPTNLSHMLIDLTGCNRNAARQMVRNSIAGADRDQRVVACAHAAQKFAHV